MLYTDPFFIFLFIIELSFHFVITWSWNRIFYELSHLVQLLSYFLFVVFIQIYSADYIFDVTTSLQFA